MRCYQSRNPLAATSPLRSCQWGRPAYLVLGVPAEAKAQAAVRIARDELAGWARQDDAARAELGAANRRPAATRKYWQGQAMRKVNAIRKAQREAVARLVAAELALAALATAQA